VGAETGPAAAVLPTLDDPQAATAVGPDVLAARGIGTTVADDAVLAQINTGGGDILGDVIILGKDASAVFPVKVERIVGDDVVVRDTRTSATSAIPRGDFQRMWSDAGNRTVSGTDMAKLAEWVTPIAPLPAPTPLAATDPIAETEEAGGPNTGLMAAAAIGLPLVVGGGYLAARRIRG
jgi:hypothetical protein